MDPTGSPFRRPPQRPAFRPRQSGFGPVPPAASLTAAARGAARVRSEPRESRARALRLRAGAFYLAAGLTLLDAALSFVALPGVTIGLGLVRWLADASAIEWVALPLVAGFTAVGAVAQRGRLWAFAVGAAVYALDGLIVLAAQDWVGVAIHTAVLVMMARGLDAGRRRP